MLEYEEIDWRLKRSNSLQQDNATTKWRFKLQLPENFIWTQKGSQKGPFKNPEYLSGKLMENTKLETQIYYFFKSQPNSSETFDFRRKG